MPTPLAAGDNYEVTLDGRVALARVWRRPDLDSTAGARSAAEMIELVRSLTNGRVRGVVLDIREAPPIAGPKTSSLLGALLRTFEGSRVKLAIVIADDPMQRLQFGRLVTSYAPTVAVVTNEIAEASRWAAS